jgi:hypothetical protein
MFTAMFTMPLILPDVLQDFVPEQHRVMRHHCHTAVYNPTDTGDTALSRQKFTPMFTLQFRSSHLMFCRIVSLNSTVS